MGSGSVWSELKAWSAHGSGRADPTPGGDDELFGGDDGQHLGQEREEDHLLPFLSRSNAPISGSSFSSFNVTSGPDDVQQFGFAKQRAQSILCNARSHAVRLTENKLSPGSKTIKLRDGIMESTFAEAASLGADTERCLSDIFFKMYPRLS